MAKIIKVDSWYDPEGLKVPEDSNVMFEGTREECGRWLEVKCYTIKSKDNWTSKVESYTAGESLSVYYPNAIAREIFKLVD